MPYRERKQFLPARNDISSRSGINLSFGVIISLSELSHFEELFALMSAPAFLPFLVLFVLCIPSQTVPGIFEESPSSRDTFGIFFHANCHSCMDPQRHPVSPGLMSPYIGQFVLQCSSTAATGNADGCNCISRGGEFLHI